MLRVKPRSCFTLSATALRLDTPVPNWRSVTFLMFCAQTMGKPVTVPAEARPAVRSRRRRPIDVVVMAVVLPLPGSPVNVHAACHGIQGASRAPRREFRPVGATVGANCGIAPMLADRSTQGGPDAAAAGDV